MWYWLFKYIFMGPLLTLLGRPEIEGLEYVPDSGPVILASNHLAVADSFYLCLVVRRRITYLAKAEYFTGTGIKGWFQRWFYTAAGQVPDRPHRRRRRAGRADDRGADPGRGQAARHVPGGHPLTRRAAVQGQDRDGPGRAEDRSAGHPGRDDRHRRRQPARQQDVAVRPGEVRFGKPMDFSRFEGLAGNRFIERAVIDEVMYELMRCRARSTSTCTPPTSRRVKQPAAELAA